MPSLTKPDVCLWRSRGDKGLVVLGRGGGRPDDTVPSDTSHGPQAMSCFRVRVTRVRVTRVRVTRVRVTRVRVRVTNGLRHQDSDRLWPLGGLSTQRF